MLILDYSMKNTTLPASLGMMDRSRMGLCMFMFTILFFNPLGKTLSDISTDFGSDKFKGTGRSVLSVSGGWYIVHHICTSMKCLTT